MTAAAAAQQTAAPIISYTQIELDTQLGISLFDITPQIRQRIAELGVTEGCVNVLSRHTTTAIAINEYETRLLDDIRQVSSCLCTGYTHGIWWLLPASNT